MGRRRTTLITGGNRGIGLEVARQLGRRGDGIVLAVRDPDLGAEAAARLADEGVDARTEIVDVGVQASVLACAARLRADGVDVDVLVNNAGVYTGGDVLSAPWDDVDLALRVNFLGPFWACRAFVPDMLQRGYGRVVNVSSTSGQIADGISDRGPYGVAKAALNALTVRIATEVRATGADVLVNTMCPGWVRTRMGGPDATRSVEEGADTAVWLATLPAGGPSGLFFADRTPIPW